MTVSPEYFAGIIDGEGSIMLIRTGNASYNGMFTSWTPKVCVANTNLRLLYALQETFGGVIKQATKQGVNWKTGYRLEWFGPSAREICEIILPHLIIKADQAVLVMDALDRRVGEGKQGKRKSKSLTYFLNATADRVRRLNKRGVAA